MSPVELFRLVLESLWDQRKRVALAVLGVVIGVLAIVLLISIGTGARSYIKEQFGGIGADTVIVIPGRVETTGAIPGALTGTPHPLLESDSKAILHGVRGVHDVAAMSIGTARVARGEISRECMCIGATEEFETVRRFRVELGKFLPPAAQVSRNDRGCCLGCNVAKELFRGENPLGQQVRVSGWRFRVEGIMEPKGRQQGFDLDEIVFVSEPVARKIFNLHGHTRILVQVSSVEDQEHVSRSIKELLKARHKGVEDFTLMTAGSVVESLDRLVSILSGVLAGIAGVSLVVGGIGIANVALVATTARTEEVGIKKALGAHPGWILVQFLCESSLTGALGGGAGAGLAWLTTLLARVVFPVLPLETPLWSIGLAIGVCALIGIVAGGLPAARAAGLEPIVALRASGGAKK